MKKLLFSFFLTLSVSLSVVGQISLSFTKNEPNDVIKVSFTDFGEKFIFTYGGCYNSPSPYCDSLYLFLNPDGSTFKSIERNTYYTSGDYKFFSDKLFDNDSEIEFIGSRNFDPQNLDCDSIFIVDEFGNVEFTFPGCGGIRVEEINGSFQLHFFDKLTNTVKVFSLPGTLPCDQCGSINGLEEPNTGGGLGEMKVYPNPFNNTLQVNYDFPTNQTNPRLVLTDILGRELKEIKLTSQSDNVSINTTDLPKGTIIVSLFGGQNMISKKVIKID